MHSNQATALTLVECMHSSSPKHGRVYALHEPSTWQRVCTASALNLAECVHSNSPVLVGVHLYSALSWTVGTLQL